MSVRSEFEAVYDAVFPRVYAYYSVCFNADCADDLSQQVFMKVWKKMNEAGFCAPGDWRAWIFRIAINVKNDFLREKYKQPEFIDLEHSEHERRDIDIDNADDIDNKLMIIKALNSLDTNDRDILLLHGSGFSSKELGSVFNVPPSTVRSRLSAARKRFKDELAFNGVNVDG